METGKHQNRSVSADESRLLAIALPYIAWAECGPLTPEELVQAAFRWAFEQVEHHSVVHVPGYVVAALLPDVEVLVRRGLLSRLPDGRVFPGHGRTRTKHGWSGSEPSA